MGALRAEGGGDAIGHEPLDAPVSYEETWDPPARDVTVVGSTGLAYRIHRSATPDTVVFALSGELDLDHATRLQEFLTNEATDRVTFDLREVTLVDRPAVRFLADAEAAGIRLVNSPTTCAAGSPQRGIGNREHLDEPNEQEGQP